MLRMLFIAVFLSLYILIVGPPVLLYTLITKDPDPVYWAGLKGVLDSLSLGRLRRTTLPNGLAVWQGTLPSQTVNIYIPPSGRYYDLFVAQETFADTNAVFADLVAYQGGGS